MTINLQPLLDTQYYSAPADKLLTNQTSFSCRVISWNSVLFCTQFSENIKYPITDKHVARAKTRIVSLGVCLWLWWFIIFQLFLQYISKYSMHASWTNPMKFISYIHEDSMTLTPCGHMTIHVCGIIGLNNSSFLEVASFTRTTL